MSDENSGAVEQGGSGAAVDPSAETTLDLPALKESVAAVGEIGGTQPRGNMQLVDSAGGVHPLQPVGGGDFVVGKLEDVRTLGPTPRTTTKPVAIGDSVYVVDERNWHGPMAAVVTGGPFPRPQDGDVNPQPDGGDGCFVNVSVFVDPSLVKLGSDPAMAVPVVRHDRIPLYDAGVDPTANTDGEFFPYATWRARAVLEGALLGQGCAGPLENLMTTDGDILVAAMPHGPSGAVGQWSSGAGGRA